MCRGIVHCSKRGQTDASRRCAPVGAGFTAYPIDFLHVAHSVCTRVARVMSATEAVRRAHAEFATEPHMRIRLRFCPSAAETKKRTFRSALLVRTSIRYATFSPAPLPPAFPLSPAVRPFTRSPGFPVACLPPHASRSMPPAVPKYASRSHPQPPRSWRRSPPAPSPPAAPPPAARRTHSPTSDGTLTCRSWQASCNCIDLPGKGAAALQVGAVVAGK